MSIRLCLAIFALAIYAPSQAEIYRWVDQNGKVQFSDRKVSGVKQKVVTLEKVESDWSRYNISIDAIDVNITPKEIESIVDGVNNVYEFYDRVLYFDMYKTIPVSILILKDRDAYRNYLIERNQSNLIDSYGLYFPKDNQIIVYVRKDREGTFRTIRHEVSHAVVDTIMPYAPAWINEGLAEQMETIKRNESGLYIEPHRINRLVMAQAVKKGDSTNISDFLKLPSREWRHSLTDGKKSLQAQAGQFIYFLLATPPNRSFVIRLMHQFERGERKLSYYLVDDNYIGGVKTMEIMWDNWIEIQPQTTVNFF
ncbi:MAG: DUF4124 domain-containing protein [Cellvibrionaceae bacterium]